jgi:electron-transferring-flavoprotein dehydrogenase
VIRPADYAPPAVDAFAAPTESEPVEVDVAIVGAGPAGLAAAIRLGQLAPDLSVAVLDKGTGPGAHLLSGAVVRPGPLRDLVGEFPSYGSVTGEAVYLLTAGRAVRVPAPPTMHNAGNVVVSLSQLGRWLAEKAEAGGAMVLPETAAVSLLVEGDRVVGVRTGDKGRGRGGEELGRFEPGSDVRARVTILAEGTAGHLTGAAISRFELGGVNPQVWALGVKEVWRVARPLERVIHTLGWPLRSGARWREFGGSFIYPLGEEMVSVGMVVGLDYADAELSVHDLLQQLKTHQLVREILDGGERLQWGAKTIPEGGFLSLSRSCAARGLLLCGDGAGFVNVPSLKGVHLAVESGRLAAEAAASGDLQSYDAALQSSWLWRELREVRNMRQAFGRGLWVGGAAAGLMTATRGRFPGGDKRVERDAAQPVSAGGAAASYPAPDGKLTFDKLSSVFLSGNRTRDDQPNHIGVATRVPRELAELWARMCPAQVYEAGDATGEDGLVEVHLSPSNCVQCGAITAKGGRLTPPEGGSGPEYTLT